MLSSEPTVAVVLAGGRSRRFEGGEKALSTIDGRTLLDRVVHVAGDATGATPIVAVATADQRRRYGDALDAPARFVTDVADREGPLAGLSSALDRVTDRWVFVLGCDMPLVDRSAIEWLATSRNDGVAAVVPRTEDGIHPLHAWYRRDAVLNALEADRSERSLRGLLDRLSVTIVPAADAPDEIPLERSVANVNTRADLADARRLFGE